jgi:hypothetical protein
MRYVSINFNGSRRPSMKRVKILRDGAIGDPKNPRTPTVHAKEGDIVELTDSSADMCVNESDPPRAEYIDEKSELDREDDGGEPGSGEPGSGGEGDGEPGSGGEGGTSGGRSLLDRITGKGESSVLE